MTASSFADQRIGKILRTRSNSFFREITCLVICCFHLWVFCALAEINSCYQSSLIKVLSLQSLSFISFDKQLAAFVVWRVQRKYEFWCFSYVIFILREDFFPYLSLSGLEFLKRESLAVSWTCSVLLKYSPSARSLLDDLGKRPEKFLLAVLRVLREMLSSRLHGFL